MTKPTQELSRDSIVFAPFRSLLSVITLQSSSTREQKVKELEYIIHFIEVQVVGNIIPLFLK